MHPLKMTRQQFAEWCYPANDMKPVRAFFKAIQWPEGYVYCTKSMSYASTTGYDCIHRHEETIINRTKPS